MPIQVDYEVSSEGAVRHWQIPYGRCSPNPPLVTHAVRVTGVVTAAVGQYVTGTVLSVDAGRSIAVVDFTCSMIYRQDVRNVLTYNIGAEATWGLINIGDPVYLDLTPALIATDVYLSTSPLLGPGAAGAANPQFGWIMPYDETDLALYPKGGAGAGSTQDCGVMQRGAGSA